MAPSWAGIWVLFVQVICATSTILDWHGVNIPGLSFQRNLTDNGGVLGGGPSFPSIAHLDSWLELNATLFRFPVLWNYIQPNFDGDLDPTIMSHLDNLINHVTDTGNYAILDIHNFARFNGVIVGQENQKPYSWDLGNLWIQLAERYQGNPHVMFGIMNEPWGLNMNQWGITLQYVIDCIRINASATNQYILIPGTNWQDLSSWIDDSELDLENLEDPSQKLLFDVHKYFDKKGGYSGVCSAFSGTDFQNFTNDIRSLNARAILTEFGGKNNTGCNTTLNEMLSFLEANSDVFFGWAAWGADLNTNDTLFLNPLASAVGTSEQSVNIVRDVLVPHMKTETSICGPPNKSASCSSSSKPFPNSVALRRTASVLKILMAATVIFLQI